MKSLGLDMEVHSYMSGRDRRIAVSDQPVKKMRTWAGGMVQVIEHLPSKCKA
jgi:hypothetical protein